MKFLVMCTQSMTVPVYVEAESEAEAESLALNSVDFGDFGGYDYFTDVDECSEAEWLQAHAD